MLPKALKASDKTNIGIKQNRYIVLNVSNEELDEYIDKCRFLNQVNILNELKQELNNLQSQVFNLEDNKKSIHKELTELNKDKVSSN